MKRKYTLFVMAISLILSFETSIFHKRNGLYKFEYTLADGESLAIDPIINPLQKEDLIIGKSFPVLNSAIIRSFETESNNVTDLITYANHIASNRNVGYWSLIPNIYYDDGQYSDTRISDPVYAFHDDNGYIWIKINGFRKYYHSLFKSKAARAILFNQALDIVVSLCKSYPSDFKKSVIRELDQLLIFTNSLETLNPSTDTDKLNDYWKGFIFRRYYLDNIPISEIKTSIINAQTKIKEIDVSNQPDAMYEININNQITFFYFNEKYILYSKSSAKEIPLTYETSVQNIKYLQDNTGDYYQLTGIKNSVPFTYLYDKNLLKIE
jgi:hypothetical protein